MGMSTGGGSGGFKNDINVTPLIDVVLVLLIIAMVTLPPKLHNEEVAVPPEIPPEQQNKLPKKQVEVVIRAGRAVRIQYGKQKDNFGSFSEAAPKLAARLTGKKQFFLECEDQITWGECLKGMDWAQSIGMQVNNNKELKTQWKMASEDEDKASGAPPGALAPS